MSKCVKCKKVIKSGHNCVQCVCLKYYANQRNLEKHMKICKHKSSEIKIDNDIERFIKKILDLLRNKLGITGDNAHEIFIQFLLLRIVDIYVEKNKLIFSDEEFDKIGVTEEEEKKDLIDCVHFKNSFIIDIDKLYVILLNLLSLYRNHPILTKLIKYDYILINEKYYELIRELIGLFKDFSLNDNDYDVFGCAYEKQMKYAGNTTFGQFFTPVALKQLMLSQVTFSDEMKIYDPCAGTGGLLISAFRKIKELDLKTKNEDYYGYEITASTFHLCEANLVILNGIFPNINFGNSLLVDKYENFFDLIITNPPFGVKSQNYSAKCHKFKSEKSEYLFIQGIIYSLKIGGQGVIVMPAGFLSATNISHLRKYLLQTCDLKKIISVKSKLFENTTVAVCILVFEKKCEYNNEFSTKFVEFFNFDGKLTLDKKISIEKITSSSSLSLNSEFHIEIKYNFDNEYITLNDCINYKSGKQISEENKTNEYLSYNCYGAGGKHEYKSKIFNVSGLSCKIAVSGVRKKSCVLILDENYYLTIGGMIINSKIPEILDEYLFYYLYFHKELILSCAFGSCQPSLNKEKFLQIKIPVKSLEEQKEIIEFCREIYKKQFNKKIFQLRRDNLFRFLKPHKTGILGDYIIFKSGKKHKVSEFEKKEKSEQNPYPFFGSCKAPFYISSFDYDERAIIFGKGGSPNIHISEKFSVSGDCVVLGSKTLSLDYVYYFLIANLKKIEKYFFGSTIKHITNENIKNLPIIIPEDEGLAIELIKNEIENINTDEENYIKQFKKINDLAKDLFK